ADNGRKKIPLSECRSVPFWQRAQQNSGLSTGFVVHFWTNSTLPHGRKAGSASDRRSNEIANGCACGFAAMSEWVTSRKARIEQIWSAVHSSADLDRARDDFAEGPISTMCRCSDWGREVAHGLRFMRNRRGPRGDTSAAPSIADVPKRKREGPQASFKSVG